ncbi:MAG: EAL domain-containing protein [Acidimicrobiales bacterium]
MSDHAAFASSSVAVARRPDDLDSVIGESELLWGYLTNSALVSILCLPDGSIQWASPSVSPILGHQAQTLTGVDLTMLVDDNNRPAIRARIDGGGRSGAAESITCQIYTGDNTTLWCDVDVVHLHQSGQPQILVTMRDASRQVAGTRALRASEERFRTIVNEAPFGIGLQDRDGNFVFLNARLKQIMGTSANYLLRDELDHHIDQADLNSARSAMTAGPDTDPRTSQMRFHRPDGELRWASVRILPQTDTLGEITNYLWAVEDITARVRAEEDQARLYTLMEASSDLVIVMDPNLVPLYVNPAARRFLGIEPHVVLTPESAQLEFASQPPEALDTIVQHMSSREIWHGEVTLRSASGTWEPFSAMVVPDTTKSGELNRISAVLRDITERKQFEERLEWEATHDPLTDLPNRALLTQRLADAMERSARDGTWVAVVFLDLDNFRIINESLGHRVGDNLLKQTAQKLTGLVWSRDMVARFGADEFAIVMEGLDTADGAMALAERIRKAVSGRVGMAEVELLMTFTAGVAVTDGHRGDPASVIRDANAALHEAKHRGRDRTEVFNGNLRARAVDRLTVETGLRRALRRDELRLFYQPQISLTSGRINGAEALIRWQHPEHGLLSPGEFVPIAEQSGLIIPIGPWVIEEACRTLAKWSKELPGGDRFTMGINLSGKQLVKPTLIADIEAVLAETGVDPSHIEMEITESILLDDVDRSILVLEKLKALGLKLSLDDFGTGYSSLTYLRSFPIDVVKIDRSFVDGIGEDRENAAIVRSVVDLARTLGLSCIAEGVETESDLAELRALGCDTAQGFLFAKPLSEPDAARLISYDPSW